MRLSVSEVVDLFRGKWRFGRLLRANTLGSQTKECKRLV